MTWEHVRNERLLTRDWNDNQTAREFFASLMESGIDFVSHATSKQSIVALVAAGYGITRSPSKASQCSSGRASCSVRFREPDACVDVSLAWLAEREDAAAGLFVAFETTRP